MVMIRSMFSNSVVMLGIDEKFKNYLIGTLSSSGYCVGNVNYSKISQIYGVDTIFIKIK